MNRKIKNTLVLFILLVLIVTAGGIYMWGVQKGKISTYQKKLKGLQAKSYNKAELQKQYSTLLRKSNTLDSILAARKFNIPDNLSSIKFYDFITNISSNFSPDTHVDMELVNQGKDKEFDYYEYKLKGTGNFEDFYSLVYALEQSKELKKIASVSLDNMIVPDDNGTPNYDVGFTIDAKVYYANDDRFTTTKFVENNLNARHVYDAFYPLIRKEIPPNVNNLLNVEGAKLLALVPEGAFLSDSKGNTYLLWEGEQVYLGYLTKIDYDNNKVNFIINKGGVIEHVDLTLEKETKNNKNESPK
jgi:hypothetical protein